MDTLLFYIAVGIFINLFADMLVSYLDAEDLRLTMIERIIVLIIWPFAVLYVIAGMIKR